VSNNPKVKNHLDRILESELFQRAGRQSRFLRYVVERSLEGKVEDLKEYTIALEVFDREPSYDPKHDSTVRVEASKLRSRLERYYENAGNNDGIRIEIPKGGYVAKFIESAPALPPPQQAEREPAEQVAKPNPTRRWLIAGGLAVGAASAAAVFVAARPSPPEPLVILVAGDTAERGGYTDEAAQMMQDLSRELGRSAVRVVHAKDLNHLATESRDASYCVIAMAGRCFEDGRRIRLMAELREVNYDFRIWSAAWDEPQSKAPQLSQTAAQAISQQVQRIKSIAPPSAARLRAMEPYREALRTVRPRKDFVLQTTEEKASRTRLDELMRSARLLEDAARIDPSFTEAIAQLAWVYRLAIPYDRGMVPQAASTARRAIEVDSKSVEANYVKGYVDLLESWDIKAAESAFQRCVERSAFHVEAYRLYAEALYIRGRAKEALQLLAKPLSVMAHSKVLRYAATTSMLHAGLTVEAEKLAREAVRREPDWLLGRWELGRALEEQGRISDAEIEFRHVVRADPKNQRFVGGLAHLLAATGDPRKHREAMSLLLGIGMDKTAPALVGLVEGKCGDREKALDWMERAEREHDHNLPYAVIDRYFAPLRSSERGRRIYQRFAEG
jgi:tetratricopeptide (TPR) repeat protein